MTDKACERGVEEAVKHMARARVLAFDPKTTDEDDVAREVHANTDLIVSVGRVGEARNGRFYACDGADLTKLTAKQFELIAPTATVVAIGACVNASAWPRRMTRRTRRTRR